MSPDAQSLAAAANAMEEESAGFLKDGWYYEEGHRATRFGLRVKERLHEERSKFQHIEIYDTHFFGRLMTLDGLVMFTERDEFVYHEMLTHVPLCSLKNPQDVLIIGGGDCGCLREILKHPEVARVVQCDIDERVTRVSEKYFTWVSDTMKDPRAELIFEDGVKYIEEHKNAFDLIIIDSTDPIGPATDLFKENFYRKVCGALKPGGIMTAQTESAHWSPALVSAIYQQMNVAFDHLAPYVGMIPTYPSGSWTWCFASNDGSTLTSFDEARSQRVSESCLYYNPQCHRGAFMVPTFVRKACDGEALFEQFGSGPAD